MLRWQGQVALSYNSFLNKKTLQWHTPTTVALSGDCFHCTLLFHRTVSLFLMRRNFHELDYFITHTLFRLNTGTPHISTPVNTLVTRSFTHRKIARQQTLGYFSRIDSKGYFCENTAVRNQPLILPPPSLRFLPLSDRVPP